jgi:GNAT superfamily N-acetyltransferase
MYDIQLIPKDQIHIVIPFLKLLDEKIDESILTSRLDEMVLQGYQCVGVYYNHKLIGISGLWILVKYSTGRHIEPDNVVIHPDHRNKGIGELMMQWIHEYGKSKGCVASELNCYVMNEKGQKFWFNEGYKILGYHFHKML